MFTSLSLAWRPILIGMLVLLVIFFAAGILRVVFKVLGRFFLFLSREVLDVFLLVGSMAWLALLVPGSFFATLFGGMTGARRSLRQIGRALWTAGAAILRFLGGNLGAFFLGGPPWPPGPRQNAQKLGPPKSGIRSDLWIALAECEQELGLDISKVDSFASYQRLGSLPSGGSGALLEIARPTAEKLVEFSDAGFPAVDRVVLKSFPMEGGPTLSQIMRESRSLEVARRLGLVLEHGVDEQKFWYVMPYVPGENLRQVITKLHSDSSEGLPLAELRRSVSYVSDLLLGLERFHQAGLWHKDVKPDNLVVCGDRAHLVDLGLVTPLESGMTLTTHGTEYFRDPEMVRMAMKGTKVRDVEAAKFDIFGAGAVLYSVLEGEFPAHGMLSRLTKSCPETLRMIVRKSMAEMRERYPDVRTMLLDVHKVLEAEDPFAMSITDLPSMGGSLPQGLPAEPAPLQEYRPLVHQEARPNAAMASSEAAAKGPASEFSNPLLVVLGAGVTCFLTVFGLAAFTSVFHHEEPESIPGAANLQWGAVTVEHATEKSRFPRETQLLVLDDWNPSRDSQKTEQTQGIWDHVMQASPWLPVGEAGAPTAEDQEMAAQIRASQALSPGADFLDAAHALLASHPRYGGFLWLQPSDDPAVLNAACLLWRGPDTPDLEQALLLP